MKTGKITSLITSFFMFVMLAAPPGEVRNVSAAETMRNISTSEIVNEMGIGINLGNTFEACGDWITGNTVKDYETAWGSPVVTKDMIQGYKAAGFGVLRVPVAWSNLMKNDGTFTISKDLTARVKEVVDWALEADLYVIINIHWDNGWVNKFPENKTECMTRYEKMWTQISDSFKDYGDHLMFESQNEELGWETLWNKWSGSTGSEKTASYDLVNEVNQKFVDVVRCSGGNNGKRHLLISGYNTGIDVTCDPLFRMPSDPAGRCAVSVHYYSPSTFAILEEDADWGKAQYTWGTAQEKASLNNEMDMMKSTFADKGIPVIIGEYGCPTKNKDPQSVMDFLTSVCEAAYSRNMCPVLWDTPGGRYDRIECKMADAELNKKLCDIAGSEIRQPAGETDEKVTYKTSELKKNSKGEYIVPLGKNADSLRKAIITLSVSSSEKSGWYCGGGALTFDSVRPSDGSASFWSSKPFNYSGNDEKVVITFNGKFTDSKDNEYDAAIGCTEALLVDWWHSSEKYPEGGDDVSVEFKEISLFYDSQSGGSENSKITGDINGDGTVNAADLACIISIMLGKTEPDQAQYDAADMDGDNRLSIADVLILKSNLLEN